MAEWLIAPVLKTGIVLRTIGGSNPSLSNLQLFIAKIGFFHLFFSLILSFIERKARLDAEPEPKKTIE